MSERTNISWADHTASPWYGCAKVDPACANCYAEQWAKKLKIGWGDGAPRVRSKSFWNNVPRWQRNAAIDHLTGKPKPRIFPSLCDVFDQRAPVEWKANYWDVVMRSVNLDHLTLTKRPEFWKADMEAVNRFAQYDDYDPPNVALMLWTEKWLNGQPPANVWFGVTCGTQATADERIPILLSIPARVRWVSVEPILETINLNLPTGIQDLNWVVVGGESGEKRRETMSVLGRMAAACTVQSVVNVADQCRAAVVPVWVKQDCHRLPGQQGRIPTEYWNLKELPK